MMDSMTPQLGDFRRNGETDEEYELRRKRRLLDNAKKRERVSFYIFSGVTASYFVMCIVIPLIKLS